MKPDARPSSDEQLNHERIIDFLAYIAEHTGAVLFVAMIIRLGIEAAAQRKALAEVEDAMNERAEVAFRSVDQKVRAFLQSVSSVDESVGKVNSSISSIEGIIGGSLYGQRLKGAAKERIETSVINPVFFRPLYKLCLTLSPESIEDDDCDLLEVRVETDYTIENLTKVDQPHSIRATLDNVLFRSKTKHLQRDSKFLKCEFGEDSEQGRRNAQYQPLDLVQLERDKHVKNVGDEKRFEYTPNEKVPPHKVYFVAMTSTQLMRDSDAFYWSMQIATDVMEIEVHLKGKLTTDNFSVRATPVHHVDHGDFEPQIEAKTILRWKIDGVLLPYQGVQLWWSRKQLDSPPVAAPFQDANPSPS